MDKLSILKGRIVPVLVMIIFSTTIYQGCSSNDSPGSESVDTTPPSTPTGLVATHISATTITLSWEEATDNVGGIQYDIFLEGTRTTTLTDTVYTLTGLEADTKYIIAVRAKDTTGNVSQGSVSIEVKTLQTNIPVQVSGDITSYLGNILADMPGASENQYNSPTVQQITDWEEIIEALLARDIPKAIVAANPLGYQVTIFIDTAFSPSQKFYILEKKSSGNNHWGTYVFHTTPIKENLILQAPHALYDTNTGKEAIYCFKNTGAMALFLNGVHRCNSMVNSSCSGTTSVCGSTQPYRISDLAHATQAVFQKTTEILLQWNTNTLFIQLHGFSKRSTDPYVIMSNGTRHTPAIDYAVKLKEAIQEEDAALTFKLAHIDTEWTRLIGFTNVQGRLINQSTTPCEQSTTISSGRFIHVEQEKTRLRADEQGWKKMSNALNKVF
ncbi:fibronectin type III domain-containing protein [Aquimarina megaterium]|uniref:fibronectin type III domain-containing protein n=1 Tax=Aquimarina megaterium TaxID=1443666 RepID=UPI0004714E5D|nr:fibronectin type III domain-containing protein [Aquimarina megaterium]